MMLQEFKKTIVLSSLLMVTASTATTSAFSSRTTTINHRFKRSSPALNVGAIYSEEYINPTVLLPYDLTATPNTVANQETVAVVAPAERDEPTESDTFLMFRLLSLAKAYSSTPSGTCNLEEAESCLKDLLRQKELHASTTTMSQTALDDFEEVIANLRKTIDAQRIRRSFALKPLTLEAEDVENLKQTVGWSFARAPFQVAGAMATMCVVFATTIIMWLLAPLPQGIDQ